jgi:hypothetical protein
VADNAILPATGVAVTTDEVPYSGDTTQAQIVQLAFVTGTEGSKTLTKVPGDATNGVDVDVTRLPALVAGSAVVGKVGIDQTTPGTTNAVESKQKPASTATLANITAATSSTTILASNTSRLHVVLHNDSLATLDLKYGSSASATSYTYELQPGDHWEMPYLYTGIITGIWTSVDGAARVTELT